MVLPDGAEPVGAALRIEDGKIREVRRELSRPASPPALTSVAAEVPVLDFGDRVVMPGLVDTHAHINEPGRTDWEGFETATRAAAAGGITTVIDMPLNSIPATTSLEALQVKAASAQGKCRIDYGFWGGVVPGNAHELEPMVEAGVFGFKAFLCPSGVDEFPSVGERELREAMSILARLGVPLLVHAELESPLHATGLADPRKYQTYLDSRPQRWEVEAIRMVIRLARETRCRAHIVHLSAAEAIEPLAEARAQGVPITAETCPHYLTFTAEEIPDGATQYKCAPPIRERSNRERVWDALRQGDIDFVVSDHSPCTPGLKRIEAGDFSRAWGGIAGLQFGLPVVWTGMRERGLGLAGLARWMSQKTAGFLSLGEQKGSLVAGADADFVIFDPEARYEIQASEVLHRHRLTPYAGRPVFGRVEKTFLRGVDLGVDGSPSGQRLCFAKPR